MNNLTVELNESKVIVGQHKDLNRLPKQPVKLEIDLSVVWSEDMPQYTFPIAGDSIICESIPPGDDLNFKFDDPNSAEFHPRAGHCYRNDQKFRQLIFNHSTALAGTKSVFKIGWGLKIDNIRPFNIFNQQAVPLPGGGVVLFTLPHDYEPGSTRIYLNSVRQQIGVQYFETLPNQITFAIAPLLGDVIIADYEILY